MCAQYYRALSGQAFDKLPDLDYLHGVKPVCRLIEHQYGGVVYERLSYTHALFVAL